MFGKNIENNTINNPVIVESDKAAEPASENDNNTPPKGIVSRKVPFPKALMKKNLEKQFSKFLEIFKKLEVNIPFSEDKCPHMLSL